MKLLQRLAMAAVACTVIVAAIVSALGYALYGDRSHPATSTVVIVARGSTFDEIARQLASQGIVSNVWTFRILARLRKQDVAVHAGEYRLAPHQTQDAVLRELVSGGAQIAAWVTIPEGFTAAQIATRLEEAGIGPAPSFEREFMRETLVVDGARTRSLEGFLFPSTYLVPVGAAPSQAAGMLTAQFLKVLPADAAGRARALHVNVPQAVAVASLVEREAKSEPDRPKIAGVIYNRLRLGMPLQVDATIEYALPKHKSELSFADLKIDSPYNTYARAGLPPTPIANPGLPSLEAALHPWKSDDLYYVYCGNGRHVFAKTLADHQANVARCLR
ncbi:MAG: endolytic transglycosylase MltG [Candidatus Eremiobacteraeota bacterium]|nr:endolytic transglycosylase MltG [Candidatus Eremiobacteraeota bacterium]